MKMTTTIPGLPMEFVFEGDAVELADLCTAVMYISAGLDEVEIIEEEPTVTIDETRYYLKRRGLGVIATGLRGPGKSWLVLAGAVIRPPTNLNETYRRTYDQLVADGGIVDGLLTRDHWFPAPSHAYSIITGSTAGGVRPWKTLRGRSLHSVLKAEKRKANKG